jgi:hypothetical protein
MGILDELAALRGKVDDAISSGGRFELRQAAEAAAELAFRSTKALAGLEKAKNDLLKLAYDVPRAARNVLAEGQMETAIRDCSDCIECSRAARQMAADLAARLLATADDTC